MTSQQGLFPLGRCLITPTAQAELDRRNQGHVIDTVLRRHALGDWGEVPPEDAQLNDEAVKNGDRLLSAYTCPDGLQLWVVTEWDRSRTTVMLPEDY
jgi:hypothetical protein